MAKKKYNIDVVFSTSVYVSVMAKDLDEAMDKAEYKASKEFRDLLDDGLLGASDFTCEAQTP